MFKNLLKNSVKKGPRYIYVLSIVIHLFRLSIVIVSRKVFTFKIGQITKKLLRQRLLSCFFLHCSVFSVMCVYKVALYKLLFDALVRGEVKKEHILEHLKLRASLALGTEVISHAANVGIIVVTFGELLDAFLLTLSCSDLPCVDVLQLEYCHQETSSLIGTVLVQFDEPQLRAELRGYLEYWRGQREPKGVDIEDAWKCTSCVYEEICDWRQNRYQVSESLHTSKRVNMN